MAGGLPENKRESIKGPWVMKELFELGLVRRNVATKPFVYQLSDEVRRRITK